MSHTIFCGIEDGQLSTSLAIIVLYERYFAYMKTVYHPTAVSHAKEEDR